MRNSYTSYLSSVDDDILVSQIKSVFERESENQRAAFFVPTSAASIDFHNELLVSTPIFPRNIIYPIYVAGEVA